jgi:RHS repeat-associated protein
LVPDHLGTPRIILDQTGSFANVKRHDYLPFGEELPAYTGGRTTPMGYVAGDNVRQQFTSKERDVETGLDFFGARYFTSTQGRLTSPDEFWKDSQVGDPQSWNKYTYVRNNPLKYIDPEGEKATVTIETDEEHKKAKITVNATIALWTNKEISQKDLQKAAQEYKTNIEKAWSGTYEQNGIKYDVSTTVDIKVYGSEQDATNSGAQNVLRVTESGGHSGIDAASIFGGPDTGEIALDAGTRNSEAAHEFTHILGVGEHRGTNVSNTKGALRAMSATAYDYGWAFGGAINDHREDSRQLEMRGVIPANPSGVWVRGRERSHTSTRVLGAPIKTGTGFDWWR